MNDNLLQLTILFFVIFDPLASLLVFFSATKEMAARERLRTALISIFVATVVSYTFLFFGESTVYLFGVTLNDFKVASGIILNILGIKMISGLSFSEEEKIQKTSSQAIASLIGTPLLTGPAAITTIIISVKDYGVITTGSAVTIVLLFTTIMFLLSSRLRVFFNETSIRVITTFLGLITISWGVKFIREVLKAF
jgi:multiple antibiotic resistance protein